MKASTSQDRALIDEVALWIALELRQLHQLLHVLFRGSAYPGEYLVLVQVRSERLLCVQSRLEFVGNELLAAERSPVPVEVCDQKRNLVGAWKEREGGRGRERR